MKIIIITTIIKMAYILLIIIYTKALKHALNSDI